MDSKNTGFWKANKGKLTILSKCAVCETIEIYQWTRT